MSDQAKTPWPDDLPRDADLSRAYRESAELTPPPALDARILAAAAAAVKPSAQRRPLPWWRRWAAPAGVLATMTLTVVLVLELQREQEVLINSQLPKAAIPADSPTQKVSPPPMAETAAAAKTGRALTTTPSVSAPASVGASNAAGAVPAAAPGKTEAEPPATASVGNAAPAEARRTAVPEIAPGVAPGVASGVAPDLAADKRTDAAPAAPVMASPFFKEARRSRAEPAPAREAAMEGSVAKSPAAPRLPEPWLADIRRLKGEGRLEEAAEQLRRFREAYPDYRLPEDLR